MEDRVTIIGAGIVGICTALSLLERGASVRLIDRSAPGQETSYGNAGVISPWSIIPQAVPGIWKSIPAMLFSRTGPLAVHPKIWPKMIPWGVRMLAKSSEAEMRKVSDAMSLMCDPSILLFRRHLAGTGHEDLIADSWYVHAFRNPDNAQADGLGYAVRREKGAEIERINAADLRALEPALSSDFKAAVLIKGQARARAPGRIATVLADKARRLGAEIVQADVLGLTPSEDHGWTLDTSTGPLHSNRVVLSAGVWSAALLKPLGLTPPLLAERGYHVEFPDSGVAVQNSIMDVDAKVVASSMEGGLRIAGTSEFAPLDAPANTRKQDLLRKQAAAMFPDLNPDGCRVWMGRRPSFPDSLPAVGEIVRHKGLFAAFGHCHYGLMMAPKTGEIVADLVTGTTPNSDLSPFDPLRF